VISIDQWIYETIGSDSLRQAASLASLSQATLSRQLTNKSVTVETAVKIARAYQVSVIPALMALDIVTENDISEFASEAAIQDASDEILSAEVLRRMKAGSALINAPIDEVEQHLAEHKRRKANKLKPEPKPDVSTEMDHDAIIEQINAGKVKFAAQKHTPPLEENTP
jgi:hypothetical protein